MMRNVFVATVLLLLGASPAWAVVFNHAVHLAEYTQDEPCDTCHLEGAAQIVPDRKVCAACHDDEEFVKSVELPGLKTHGPTWSLNHSAAARGLTFRQAEKEKRYDCAACHQQQFCVECHGAGFPDEMGAFGNNMINVHSSDFTVTHPIAARTDQQLCTKCHENRFCSDCHNAFAPEDLALLSHRKGWSELRTSPSGPAHQEFNESDCQECHEDSVLPSHDWSGNHAREARKNLATCQACHPEGDVCLKCHSAVSGLGINPHPSDWGSISETLDKASGGRTCIKCH